MRRRLLTILFTLLAPFAAHAEWLIAECSAYTPYDCGIENCIDIFMESYEDAIQFGRQYKEVYVKR